AVHGTLSYFPGQTQPARIFHGLGSPRSKLSLGETSVISWSGRWHAAKLRLRMHSQFAGFIVGLVLAVVSSWLWYHATIGPILGSLLVGVGAAVIAAAIFAYLTPFNEPAIRKF